MNKSRILKKAAKNLAPPILEKVYRKLREPKMDGAKFVAWWQELLAERKSAVPAELMAMVNAFVESPSFKSSSNYWLWLNRKNILQLIDDGFDNFKQTVARNYFTFVEGLDGQYCQKLLGHAAHSKLSIPLEEVLKKHEHFTLSESVNYNLITILLYDLVTKEAGTDLVASLEEPLVGNPPYINISGRRVSQDTLNGIIEFKAISRGVPLEKVSAILEVGAGSGRTAYVLLKQLKSLRKYYIVDIPPALYISQTYLSRAFPERKVFKFRPFSSYSEVAGEMEAADLVFLQPHQLELLPKKCIDLFLAIDCLHEMKKEELNRYFEFANKLAKFLYFKSWQETMVPFDNVKHSMNSYPIRPHWKEKFKENCEVPSAFFHAFYELE